MPSSPFISSAYRILFHRFGPQHWWPGETPFEVMVGAILTQNTHWSNVEKAIANLKQKKVLSVQSLHAMSRDDLATLIRPAGYFNIKARRLKNFIEFIVDRYDGKIERMKQQPLRKLRQELLAVNGIGKETADSILLYALDKQIFVIDAYTKRLLYRHGLVESKATYDEMQQLFDDNFKEDIAAFNEYHALIVHLGKYFCKPTPRCEACPLNECQYSLKKRCDKCYRASLIKKCSCQAD